MVHRRHLASTPVAYIWGLRLERAHVLVRRTGFTLAEIAASTGFESPFHLSRKLKGTHGLSPRDLRRQAQASSI